MELCKIFTYSLADYGGQLQDEKIIKIAGSLCSIKKRENIIKDAQSTNPISDNPVESFKYTSRGNMVAVMSNGRLNEQWRSPTHYTGQ